jgi:dTMP kinase
VGEKTPERSRCVEDDTPVECGKLITVEGLDGVGKGTAIHGDEALGVTGFVSVLREIGIDVVTVREPGGTQIGERIRALLKDPAFAAEIDGAPNPETMDDKCEALLFAAARAQIAAQVIKPALRAGSWVVCDRGIHSTIAYQGHGRHLGGFVGDISRWALGFSYPDRVLLLELSAEEAAQRQQARDGAGGSDRIELSGERFMRDVASGFKLAQLEEPSLIRSVSADGTPGEVVHSCLVALVDLVSPEQRGALVEHLAARPALAAV